MQFACDVLFDRFARLRKFRCEFAQPVIGAAVLACIGVLGRCGSVERDDPRSVLGFMPASGRGQTLIHREDTISNLRVTASENATSDVTQFTSGNNRDRGQNVFIRPLNGADNISKFRIIQI